MGARILATGVSLDPATGGALAHAVAAGRACLAAAGLSPDDVELLIYVGVYRDGNMVEPAMAAIVQGDLGIRPEYTRDPRACLSFDVMNGACGLLHAVQVAAASLALGDARRVLVVSADAHPSGRDAPDFPYASAGAAMLLGPDAGDGRGFGPVRFRDADGGGPGVRGFVPVGESGAAGRERVVVRIDDDATARMRALAEDAARACLAEAGLAPAEALLVATRTAPGLAARLGMTAVETGDLVAKDPHTSALTIGYHRAAADGPRRPVLFVAAGAGPTAACAVYRP
jgi:3-oxoacyl-[acyl-carrier-protein] synthase-3